MSSFQTEQIDQPPKILLISRKQPLAALISDFLQQRGLEVFETTPETLLSHSQILTTVQTQQFYKTVLIYGFHKTSSEELRFLQKMLHNRAEPLLIIGRFDTQIDSSLNLTQTWVEIGLEQQRVFSHFSQEFESAQQKTFSKKRSTSSQAAGRPQLIFATDIIEPPNLFPPGLDFMIKGIGQEMLLDPEVDLYPQTQHSFFQTIQPLLLKPHQAKIYRITGKKINSSFLVKEAVRLASLYYRQDLKIKPVPLDTSSFWQDKAAVKVVSKTGKLQPAEVLVRNMFDRTHPLNKTELAELGATSSKFLTTQVLEPNQVSELDVRTKTASSGALLTDQLGDGFQNNPTQTSKTKGRDQATATQSFKKGVKKFGQDQRVSESGATTLPNVVSPTAVAENSTTVAQDSAKKSTKKQSKAATKKAANKKIDEVEQEIGRIFSQKRIEKKIDRRVKKVKKSSKIKKKSKHKTVVFWIGAGVLTLGTLFGGLLASTAYTYRLAKAQTTTMMAAATQDVMQASPPSPTLFRILGWQIKLIDKLIKIEMVAYAKELIDLKNGLTQGFVDLQRIQQYQLLTLQNLWQSDFKESPLIYSGDIKRGNTDTEVRLRATPRLIDNAVERLANDFVGPEIASAPLISPDLIESSGELEIAKLLTRKAAAETKAYDLLSMLQAEMKNVNLATFDPKQQKELKRFQERLVELRKQLVKQQQLQPLLPDLLGLEGKRVYLVVLQDNQELRPTGGFIQAVAVITVNGGQIIDKQVFNASQIDQQMLGALDAPAEVKMLLGEDKLFLRDANWDPDFPTTAERVSWFVKEILNKQVDGVIGLNYFLIEDALSVMGEVEVNNYGEIVTAANLYERLNLHAAEEQNQQLVENFQVSLLTTLLQKVPQLSINQQLGLFNVFRRSLEQKQTLISLSSKSQNQTLKTLDWTGSVVEPNCPPEFNSEDQRCWVDPVYQVETNVGINKVNPHVTRNVIHQVEISKEGVKHQRKINYNNLARSRVWPLGEYRVYLRFYLSTGATQEVVTVDGQELPDDQMYAYMDHGRKVVAFLLTVPALSEREVLLSYRLNQRLQPGDAYLLFNQRQPGVEYAGLGINFKLSPDLRPELVAPQADVQDNMILFEPDEFGHDFVGVKVDSWVDN